LTVSARCDTVAHMKKNNRYIALAHSNSKELTYRNVDIPDVVPLYIDFDLARQVGRAFLRPKGERIYAIIELDNSMKELDKFPEVILGLEGNKFATVNDTNYALDGVVTVASIFTPQKEKTNDVD